MREPEKFIRESLARHEEKFVRRVETRMMFAGFSAVILLFSAGVCAAVGERLIALALALTAGWLMFDYNRGQRFLEFVELAERAKNPRREKL